MSRNDYQPDTSGYAPTEQGGSNSALPPTPSEGTPLRCITPSILPASADSLKQFYRNGVPQHRIFASLPVIDGGQMSPGSPEAKLAARLPQPVVIASAPAYIVPPIGPTDFVKLSPSGDQTITQPTGTKLVVIGEIDHTGTFKYNGTALATVATSGSYLDLINRPQLAQSMASALHKWLKSYDQTTGLFTQTQPDYADLANPPQLAQTAAAVATKFLAAYNQTTGLFTLTQPDWTAISGKPSFATVATTGAYADLTGKPTIPAAGIPTGGTTGQSLTKIDNADYNVEWSTVTGGGTHAEPLTDGDSNFIFAGGDVVMILGVPN